MQLTAAITAVEAAAAAALASADGAQNAAQSRFELAAAAKDLADVGDAAAITDFNAALEDLITAAAAARVDRAPQLSPPAAGPIAIVGE